MIEPRNEYRLGGVSASGVWFADIGASLYNLRVDPMTQMYRLAEGGIFVDGRPVMHTPEYADLAMEGPMFGLDLDPFEFRHHVRGTSGEVSKTIAPGSGGLAHVASRARAKAPLGRFAAFDRVGVGIWASLYFDVGAAIGTRRGDSVIWSQRKPGRNQGRTWATPIIEPTPPEAAT